MKRPSRDAWLALGLFVVLAALTAVAAAQQTRSETAPPLASTSSAPNGARALRLWLEALEYPVADEPVAQFALPEAAAVALVLEPTFPIVPDDWEVLDAWVEQGGTLVIAGDTARTALAVEHFGFTLRYLDEEARRLSAQTPLLASPPLDASANVRARAYFEASEPNFVAHLAAGSRPVLASIERGAGRVILSAAPYAFTNAGLKEAGNGPLVLNLIAAGKRPGAVWFDEWHHGVRADRVAIVGPENWLRHTPSGRALLYSAGIIFLTLVVRGRGFGRPVPLPRQAARRGPMEYVTAIANLSRRAGHRPAVLHHYRQWLKRGLGQRYRLDPTLPDDEYVRRLAAFDPALDSARLKDLLARMRQARPSEPGLIRMAAEVADWLKES